MLRELRPHQQSAMDALRRSIGSGHRRVVLQMPTGAGKTLLAAAVVDGALRKDKRVTFVVPALSLVDQTVEAFYNEGIRDVGVIQASHAMTNWSKPVQVASVQTLMRRGNPKSGVVIIDEVHRYWDHYGKWMLDAEWANVPFIGLSATPWTRGLGRYFTDLIIAATTQELIDAGYLSKFRVFAPSHPDLSKVRTVAGDFHEGDLSEVMNGAPLVADVVDTWLKLGEGRSTLCFGVDRAHAKHLQQRFLEAGVPTGYIDALTPDDERKRVGRMFACGEYRVVCNVGCLTTGVDWDVRCIVLARPTRSEMLYTQIIGRGLRRADGKDDCLILDHSDTTLRLGFVTDIHHDTLDDGRERAKAKPELIRLPKECKQCSFLKPPGVGTCPACGFKAEVVDRTQTGDGELAEIAPKAKKAKAATPADKQKWWSALLGYAEERSYQRGWAANKYREKFDVWPRGLADDPIFCDGEIRSWVKSRQIAWAKSKGTRNAGTSAAS